MDSFETKIIAKIHTDFPTKFGIPRQSGLIDELKGIIVFEPEYRNPEALRGIEGFTHLWLIWQFSESVRDEWSPTVRPPRLGGNKRVGVFATRSPFRPNAIGLSCVKLCEVKHDKDLGHILVVSGVDMMDGTPIVDIKPYLPISDSHPDAASGFAKNTNEKAVEISNELLERVQEDKRTALLKVLAQDPRPAYHDDPERIYYLEYADYQIKFQVTDDVIRVINVK